MDGSTDGPTGEEGQASPAQPAGASDGGGDAVAIYGRPRGPRHPGATRRPIPPKLYRIGEVAAYAGTTRQTIHNYTTMGLLQESQWSEGGHRLYDETVFFRLDEILSMKAERRSLQDIRRRFQDPGLADAGETAPPAPDAGRP